MVENDPMGDTLLDMYRKKQPVEEDSDDIDSLIRQLLIAFLEKDSSLTKEKSITSFAGQQDAILMDNAGQTL